MSLEFTVQFFSVEAQQKYKNRLDLFLTPKRCRILYGRFICLTDQDVDGSHIKGLIINFIQMILLICFDFIP